VWNSVGAAPRADEIEVAVMGPGHGEAVVVHLGDGRWMVVDSCVDSEDGSRSPSPLLYLSALGVTLNEAVELIVASHWDDDHVQGLGRLVEECPRAIFCCPSSLTKREFDRYVERLSTGARTTQGANVSEFRKVLDLLADRDQPMLRAVPGRQVLADPLVRTWSPSDHEQDLFLTFVARDTPEHAQGHRKAVPGSPNLTSTVITIEWPEACILLGGDMESHEDSRRGWIAVVNEATRLGVHKGDLVKIPHHGSHTGHHDRMWTDMLLERPIAVIAPYGRGRLDTRPPKPPDVRRIRSLSRSVYQTARHRTSGKNLSPSMRLALEAGLIRLNDNTVRMGLVRFRKAPGVAWRTEIFGAAFRH
jgi:glyoxylase-like metal-dependent hydrolase (beta-lactamase superfamily II)